MSFMARKLRIEYPGALYHVINRGNYRRDLFETTGAAKAFEETMLEACARWRWRLQAHVVMRNHYHLAVETPEANLVGGMHWLQSTFSTRFNRYREENGHLFQGRYRALLIENRPALARVIDYIHLNPVRAKIVTVEQLGGFRWSSLRWFHRGARPSCLEASAVLLERNLSDSPEGWCEYLQYLQVLAVDAVRQRELGFEEFSRGWAIGTNGWKRALAKDFAQKALHPGMDAAELAELREANWLNLLQGELKRAGRELSEVGSSLKGATWKVDVARGLRSGGVPYKWIAEVLRMGKPSSVRAYVNARQK